MRRLLIPLMVLFIISCGEDIVEDNKYDNPIGAINITKEDNLDEFGKIHWSPLSDHILYAIDIHESEYRTNHIAKKYLKDSYPYIYRPLYYKMYI